MLYKEFYSDTLLGMGFSMDSFRLLGSGTTNMMPVVMGAIGYVVKLSM